MELKKNIEAYEERYTKRPMKKDTQKDPWRKTNDRMFIKQCIEEDKF